MTGAILPLPEPPAETVDEVLELLRSARGYYRDAEQQAELMLSTFGEDADAQPLTRAAAMYYRVELTVAQQRMRYWESMVGVLEHRARTMGLHP